VIQFDHVGKTFGETQAIADFSLRIDEGALCVLIGPSGCGKSTVLRMINAMIAPDEGTISVDGENLRAIEPVELRRKIGYVIQSVGLFPHWTIAENIAAVPRLLGWSAARRTERIEAVAAQLHIDPALLPRYPHELSGGQQQRVGVARALAADPGIILMDEPFAALDPLSRALLQDELRRLHAQSRKTIVFVTHDMDEALHIATTMVVMRRGHIVQAGPPAEILQKPAEDFIHNFVGGDALPLRLLDIIPVRERTRAGKSKASQKIAASASLKEALALMIAHHVEHLGVEDGNGILCGEINLADIIAGKSFR
jgi:osmoprotectant transport system ATP-binding protein